MISRRHFLRSSAGCAILPFFPAKIVQALTKTQEEKIAYLVNWQVGDAENPASNQQLSEVANLFRNEYVAKGMNKVISEPLFDNMTHPVPVSFFSFPVAAIVSQVHLNRFCVVGVDHPVSMSEMGTISHSFQDILEMLKSERYVHWITGHNVHIRYLSSMATLQVRHPRSNRLIGLFPQN